MTEYIILRKNFCADLELTTQETGSGEVWEQYGGAAYDASSARRALAAAKVPAGEYVAIPARSFVPLTVKTETITKTTIA